MAIRNDVKKEEMERMLVFEGYDSEQVIEILDIPESTYYNWYRQLRIKDKIKAQKNSPFKSAMAIMKALPNLNLTLDAQIKEIEKALKSKEVDIQKIKDLNTTLKAIRDCIITAKKIYKDVNLVNNAAKVLREFMIYLKSKKPELAKKVFKYYAEFNRDFYEKYTLK